MLWCFSACNAPTYPPWFPIAFFLEPLHTDELKPSPLHSHCEAKSVSNIEIEIPWKNRQQEAEMLTAFQIDSTPVGGFQPPWPPSVTTSVPGFRWTKAPQMVVWCPPV